MNQSQHGASNKIIEEKNLLYSINEEEKTASVIGIKTQMNDIFIPRSITYLTSEYIVKNISNRAFELIQIKSVTFAKDSQLQRIESGSFSLSTIEMLQIPATVTDLEDGWCHETSDLREIIIDQNNPRYQIYNNKMIIGKKSIESTNFDVLIFCFRDVESAIIPDFITVIGVHSFSGCESLTKVEFSENSQLEIIKEDAFNGSGIESFTVPLHVTKICDGAFCFCNYLQTFEILPNSELQAIEKEAFFEASIESLKIPQSLIDLQNGWCNGMTSLKSIEVDPNNWKYSIYNDKLIIGKSTKEQENFDILVFCVRDVETVEIPDFIKIIGPFAFDCSDIEYLSIPKGVTKISTSSFSSCENLQKIEIPEDSKLETIEGEAFSWASIENLTFPSNLFDLKEKWCYSTNITNIKVDPKNQFFSTYDDGKLIIGKSSRLNEEYDHLVFCMRNIKSIKIPSFIRVIKSFAFHECDNLKKVEIPANSELQIIEKYALSCVSIDKFTISPHLIIIGEYAFSSCNKLRKIEIQKDPQLQIISKYAFSWTSIKSFLIPSSVSYIGNRAFYKCQSLQIIEIEEGSKVDIKNNDIFGDSSNSIVMIPRYLSNPESL